MWRFCFYWLSVNKFSLVPNCCWVILFSFFLFSFSPSGVRKQKSLFKGNDRSRKDLMCKKWDGEIIRTQSGTSHTFYSYFQHITEYFFLTVIADTCGYCVLFITTLSAVHCLCPWVLQQTYLFLYEGHFGLPRANFSTLVIYLCLPFPPAGFGSSCVPWLELSPIRLSPCPDTAVQGLLFKGHPLTAPRGLEQSWHGHFWRRSYSFSRNCGPCSVH